MGEGEGEGRGGVILALQAADGIHFGVDNLGVVRHVGRLLDGNVGSWPSLGLLLIMWMEMVLRLILWFGLLVQRMPCRIVLFCLVDYTCFCSCHCRGWSLAIFRWDPYSGLRQV